jgi:hypothetical protein
MTTKNIKSQDEDQIRRTIDARASAIRSKNVQGVLQNFAKNSVGYFVETPLQQSPSKKISLAGSPRGAVLSVTKLET